MSIPSCGQGEDKSLNFGNNEIHKSPDKIIDIPIPPKQLDEQRAEFSVPPSKPSDTVIINYKIENPK